MGNLKTLILNKADVGRIINIKMAMSSVEAAFKAYSLGRALMPSKVYLDLKFHHGDFRAMPAYIRLPQPVASLKWVNVHAGNAKKNLPTVMAVLVLSDPTTGFPLAIMEATQITSFRTGAAGGVAAKYLARKQSHVIALVGCGVQSHTQLLALKENFSIRRVSVWGYSPEHIKQFLRQSKSYKLNVAASSTVKDCVSTADIIVTTTPSQKPLVKLDWVKPGTHINAIGADAPGKQELDNKLIQYAKVIVDDIKQSVTSGEINVPISKGIINKKHIYANIGDIIARKKKGRAHDKEITVFDSTGLAIQDAALAFAVYKEALKRRIGRRESFV